MTQISKEHLKIVIEMNLKTILTVFPGLSYPDALARGGALMVQSAFVALTSVGFSYDQARQAIVDSIPPRDLPALKTGG